MARQRVTSSVEKARHMASPRNDMPHPPSGVVEWACITSRGEVIISVAQTWHQAITKAQVAAQPATVSSCTQVKARV